MIRTAGVLLGLTLVAGCSASSPSGAPSPSTSPSSSLSTSPPGSPAGTPAPQRVSPGDLRVDTAVAAVEHLADRVGPRPGTTPAYFRAAGWVERELEALGWQVERQRFRTPAGYSWVAQVAAGPSVNVVASRGDVRPGEPWLAVGAHLDTVPRSPGAEDNASGVGVLLAVAEAVAARQTRLPVVLVAFGSEEPRGPTDDDHHYGSRAYVDALAGPERRSLAGMVSLDRVGVGDVLPVGSPTTPSRLRAELLAAARAAGVATVAETGQRSSDHWSFVRAGLPGVRLGSTPYAGYHDVSDVPAGVDRDQLTRTGRTLLAWLR